MVDHAEVVMCARYDELDDLKLLIEAKANLNHKDYNGSSALHMGSCCVRSYKLCDALLKCVHVPM